MRPGAARSRLRRPTGFEIHAVRDYAPGRAAAGGALAEHGPARAADGEGARRRAARRPRDRPRPGSRRRGRADRAVELRRGRARGGRPRARPRAVEPARRPRRDGAGDRGCAHPRRRATTGSWRSTRSRRSSRSPARGSTAPCRSPSAAITRAREIVVVTGRPDRAVEPLLELRRGGRSVSLVDPGLRDLRRPAARPAAARRAARSGPGRAGGGRHGRDPDRRGSRRPQRGSGQWLASSAASVGGCSPHPVPVAAVAYAWASLETAPSARVFAGVAALAVAGRAAVEAGRPGRRRRRDARRPDARRRRNERRGGAGRRRPGAAGHLRRRAAVRPEDPLRAACARAPHRLRVLPRDRGHRRQPAVPRRSGRRRRDRLARHDPAGPEHDRDGRARRCSRRSGRS